jgi:hypothetical protein
MVTNWFRFAFRQLAIALAIVTIILLLSEILLPSSILPYFNLHILVLVALLIAVASPLVEEKSRWRPILIVPIFALILLYAWFIFGMSTTGLMLFAALTILLVGLTVALSWREEHREPILVEQTITETIITDGKGFEIIREETDVFMR